MIELSEYTALHSMAIFKIHKENKVKSLTCYNCKLLPSRTRWDSISLEFDGINLFTDRHEGIFFVGESPALRDNFSLDFYLGIQAIVEDLTAYPETILQTKQLFDKSRQLTSSISVVDTDITLAFVDSNVAVLRYGRYPFKYLCCVGWKNLPRQTHWSTHRMAFSLDEKGWVMLDTDNLECMLFSRLFQSDNFNERAYLAYARSHCVLDDAD